MRWTTKEGICATLLYSELFDYPLSSLELYRWFITQKGQSVPIISLHDLQTFNTDGRYYTNGNIVKLTKLRKKREYESGKKWNIANKALFFLRFIPTIDIIGISGSLAMNNADEDDDIDLFIVCHPYTIWSTRLCLLAILQMLRLRRTFGHSEEKNLICPNMFIVKNRMRLPPYHRNIYSAHEVLQMQPIFVRGDSYLEFIHENRWTRNVLVNAWKWRVSFAQQQVTYPYTLYTYIGRVVFSVFEPLSKYIQYISINRHRTTEIVNENVMRFHPNDVTSEVQKKFVNKLRQYHIPLDSQIF